MKVNIFQTVKKNFEFVGINSQNLKEHKDPFDRKIPVVFCIFLSNVILNLVYFICVAKNLMEILQSGFMIISSIYDFTLYSLFVLNTMKWIQLIDNLEEVINESE